MVGNSWLAISQYFIAAVQPPHLKCIAPLEGASDFYRKTFCRGGVANPVFAKAIAAGMFGRSQQEDVMAMIMKYLLWNEYWEDKCVQFERFAHGGFIPSIRGDYYIQVEWYDLYQQDTDDELQKFFDRYMKGIENDWESTPKVRVSILRCNVPPIINQIFDNWPIPATNYDNVPRHWSTQHDQASLTRSSKLSVRRQIRAERQRQQRVAF
ncbi:hypothetical protein H2198_005149 [Neophaeococcomyces mojaviensis]|uniref:Uncharacterized protein n=1 Tax=Neophaeococcomyces mojaviensis TaxID=3383035 RepID=A0ACC3A6K7_9EURO|nr:hypothetical protein H2198_005149 [Knufia sp. JES_112]